MLARPRWLRSDDDLGYLLRVLRNTFLTRLRDRGRRLNAGPLPEDADRLPDPSAADPLAALESREIFTAIAALPGDYRDALVAVDVAGLSYREAARALGTKEGTIMSRLYRARGRIAETVGG